MFYMSKDQAVERLSSRNTFEILYSDTGVLVEIYKPHKTDYQSPHRQPELYFVCSGSGKFECEGEVQNVAVGDVLQVPARADHRFTNFTDDFATWVVFYDVDR